MSVSIPAPAPLPRAPAPAPLPGAPLPGIVINDGDQKDHNAILPPAIDSDIFKKHFKEINNPHKYYVHCKQVSHGKQWIAKCLSDKNLSPIETNFLPCKNVVFYWIQREHMRKEHEIFGNEIYDNYGCVGYIPSQDMLAEKAKFCDVIYGYYNKYAWDVTPLTYHIKYNENNKSWNLNYLKNIMSQYNKNSLWVVKSSIGSLGEEVHVFKGNNIDKLNTFLLDKFDVSQWKNNGMDWFGDNCYFYSAILQEYIDKPLLYKGKFKFDLRVYTLVATTNPCLLFFHKGKMRICGVEYKDISKYSNNNNDYMYGHLTNCKIQRSHKDYNSLNSTINGETMLNDWDNTIKFFHDLCVNQKYFNINWYPKEYRNKDINSLTLNDIENIVHTKCKEVIKLTYDCVAGYFDDDYIKYKRYGQFCFHGVDIIVDENGIFSMLEVNRCPSISLIGHKSIKEMTKKMLKEMIDIELEIRDKRMNGELIDQNIQLKSVKYWEPIKMDYRKHIKHRWNKSIQILNELIHQIQF